MEIRSFSQLEKALKKMIQDTMQDEVAFTVKKTIQNNVASEVYATGDPVAYQRRKLSNGSLGDIEEMESVYNNGVLEVSNNADFNHNYAQKHGYGEIDLDNSLAYNIEYGYGEQDEWWNEPRPFMETSRDELREGEFRKSLKKALEARGLDVE